MGPDPTPGPWEYAELDPDNAWVVTDREDPEDRTYLFRVITEDAEGKHVEDLAERIANGELAAASPTLRDTLQAILGECDYYNGTARTLEDAETALKRIEDAARDALGGKGARE